MPFETFKRQRIPASQEPSVTVQKRGAISLNAAAYEALGSPKHVELLYDREERLMGFRKTTAATVHAYAVKPAGKSGSTHVVAGKAFLGYYDISRDVARRWIAEERDGMLVVDLKQPGTLVTSHSSRATAGGS